MFQTFHEDNFLVFASKYACLYLEKPCQWGQRFISETTSIHNDPDGEKAFFGHYPGGSSIFTWFYFRQQLEFGDGQFKDYDHGPEKNLHFYGQEQPPIIDLSKIDVPTVLFVGKHDTIVNPEDTQWIKDQMKTVIDYKEVDGGHQIFFTGKNASYFTTDVMGHLSTYNPIITKQ